MSDDFFDKNVNDYGYVEEEVDDFNEKYKNYFESFESVLEYDFDFETYMQEKLRDIEDIKERKFAKDAVFDVFEKVIKLTENKYKNLEKLVLDEIALPEEKFSINTTIINRRDFDATNTTFFPICEEDVKPRDKEISNYFNVDTSKSASPIRTFFLKGSLESCKNFYNKIIEGAIVIDEVTYKCNYKIVQAYRYNKKVEELYQKFIYNGIRWTTVNMSFIERMFDVYIDNIDGTIMPNDEIDGINVPIDDFNYDSNSEILQNFIPIWNIEEVTLNSLNTMVPCIDNKYYDHEVYLKESEFKNGYLMEKNKDLVYTHFEKGKVKMRTLVQSFQDWNAVKFVNDEPIRSLNYKYPIISNKRKVNFTRRYLAEANTALKTEMDYIRRIKEFGFDDYIEYVGYEVLKREELYKFKKAKNMNWFIDEGVFSQDDRKVFVLKLRIVDKSCFYVDSIINFIVSQIQFEEEAFTCVPSIVD